MTRMTISFAGCALVLALGASFAAPGWAADDSPYVIDKKLFKKQIKSVAVAPLDVPPMFDLTPETVSMIEAEVVERLTRNRFDVIDVAEYRRIRDMMADQVGGYVSDDGTYDTARMAAVWDHSRREMLARHPVDAIVNVSITNRSAAFENDRAEWDGVKQGVESTGDGLGALFGGGRYQGTIAAASLQLAFFDRNGALLFVNRGGIEVLQRREKDRLVLRPTEEMLQDEKKLDKAVKIAVKPL